MSIIIVIYILYSKLYVIFETVDILQTSGRPIRATPVAPKRSQSSEASNWELLPLPNATDVTSSRTEKKTFGTSPCDLKAKKLMLVN